MKAMDVPFHLPYGRLISIHRLQRKINFGPLRFFLLVGEERICPLIYPRPMYAICEQLVAECKV